MAMDVSQLHAKDRKYARKNLLKKIDSYNKELRKTRRPSFPLSGPTKHDLSFKGVLKVKFDRGFAVQTKSVLLESNHTASDVVDMLFSSLGLRGSPADYALEESNGMTGEVRLLGSTEFPLSLQLNYGPHQSCFEVQLVQVSDTFTSPALTVREEEEGEENPNVVPKEEVIDHGIASIEIVMEEALQDIPPLVFDIQERLRGLSETVAIEGKPRSGLPNRRLLWDVLKPKASALVKDIRRLVDNGEFLANRHCNSPVFKLIVTLLLELITDYSRELVTVTKEMCGLKGADRKDFHSSVSGFVKKIAYISKLVGKVDDSLRAMALSGHLLEVTAPGNFQNGKLQSESYFSGSASVSGVLLFTIVTAYLGLVRAAYEEKKDYFSPLATNMLGSAQKAVETIQMMDEYSMLHLHPLRSRVRDMEKKLRTAMDGLARSIKVAASSQALPDATPDLLLCGHRVIMASLDFLVVAQCASLLHKVAVTGRDLMQFPWVRATAESDPEEKVDPVRGIPSLGRLSSLGSDHDSASSTADSASYYNPHKSDRERRSRIPSHQRESGDGMDAALLAVTDGEREGDQGVKQLGMRSLRLKMPYYRGGIRPAFEDSGEEADDEATKTHPTPASLSVSTTPKKHSATDLESGSATDFESPKGSASALQSNKLSDEGSGTQQGGFRFQGSDNTPGIDAVKKLRIHYIVNKAIAKGAESLLMTVTRKIATLSIICREGARDQYAGEVDLILIAARQIREEVSTMEVDMLAGNHMAESLKKTRGQMDAVEKEIHITTLLASSSLAPESARTKLMSSIEQLKDICSRTIRDALATVSEHKNSLEQAEKIEQEFITLMTGQTHSHKPKEAYTEARQHVRRNYSSPAKLSAASEADITGLVFEESAYKAGGHRWGTRDAPRVIGGTPPQLVHRLTHHRTIDPEFAETFKLTFHCFMTPEQLIDALISRFNISSPEDLSEWEEEAFEVDVIIPVKLRVIQALKAWLGGSYDDFQNEVVAAKTSAFLKRVTSSFSTCSKQLSTLLVENQQSGPTHLQCNHHGNPPASLIPMGLSHEGSFDLLDVNTMELARQLTLAYSNIFRAIRPQELTSLGWLDEAKCHLVPHITSLLQMSNNLSKLVCKEIAQESMEDDQVSVISYFLHTAKSCLELKNFEAVFAIMEGLLSWEVQQLEIWQMLNAHLAKTYDELQEMVSPEINYHRYRQELRIIHLSSTVPHLRLLLLGFEEIEQDHRDYLPHAVQGVVNFVKCRQFARIIQQVQKYQSTPYNLRPVDVMQRYLGSLAEQLQGDI